jgi:L-fuconolactonase
MMIVDSHCHATPIWYSDIDSLVFEMDRNGVEHAVLVQIGGFFDNRYQFDAVSRFPGRFANVVLADYSKPDAAQTLEQLAQQGVSGVRIAATTRSPGDDPFAIWKAAARLGLSITTGGRSANFVSPEFAQIVEAIPEVPVVIEHLGSTDNPNDDPTTVEVFQQIFSLSRYPNTYIKIHGLGEFTKRTPAPVEPFPFDRPIPPLLDLAYEAFGARRMRLLQNVDDPARFVHEIEYEMHEFIELNRQRVASDPRMQASMQTWRSLFPGSVEIDVYQEIE